MHGKSHGANMMEILFWSLVIIIIYTYVGYAAMLWILGVLKSLALRRKSVSREPYEPSVTLLVTSFNEEPWVEKKILNSLELEYPAEKLNLLWVTDGSDDGSLDIIRKYPRINHLHSPERRGKMAAINRAMKSVHTEIVIFSDANAMLNRHALKKMIPYFRDSSVGCVCGEKRVFMQNKVEAANAGEATYWRYESWLKRQEARIGSCVSAVGELFAIRRSLFREIAEDTLVDDFVISLGIALQGFQIQYSPEAFAMETGSASIDEEFKRKTRIAAGNLQAILRMPELLNPFRHGMLTFQYISHKFLRSFIVPLCFAALIPVNLLFLPKGGFVFVLMFVMQALFYFMAWTGYAVQKRRLPSRLFFIPFYIVVMNLSAIVGAFRYLAGKQSVLWEKALRKEESPEGEDTGEW
jgi:poly-beta-1,6-N-acetyl-D-glucosamine synthase